jgi:hypothetical protein
MYVVLGLVVHSVCLYGSSRTVSAGFLVPFVSVLELTNTAVDQQLLILRQ